MGKIAVLDVDAYIKKPKLAIPLLADYLREGNLALAIGTGASADLGLPSWNELVERCLKVCNKNFGTSLPESIPSNSDNKAICELMDEVEKGVSKKLEMGHSRDYRKLVKTCLYKNVRYETTVIRKDLLIALGALLMGSKRGNIREVINFNFDDVLEWYLSLHGFDTQIVTALPSLRREPDLTIYHPHGYLPKKVSKSLESDFLVLSQHSYDEKMGNRTEPWTQMFESTMESRIFLFIGLSGDDQTFGSILAAVQKKVDRDRFSAFWFFGPDVKDDRIKSLKNRNVVPLRFNSFDEIPTFLLEVCQNALR